MTCSVSLCSTSASGEIPEDAWAMTEELACCLIHDTSQNSGLGLLDPSYAFDRRETFLQRDATVQLSSIDRNCVSHF